MQREDAIRARRDDYRHRALICARDILSGELLPAARERVRHEGLMWADRAAALSWVLDEEPEC